MSLDRFHGAQARYYKDALREITAGRKRSHWIWYVFPQIAGLGTSATSREYAIQGREEAVEYLRDPVLSEHLLEITAVAAAHVRGGVAVDHLMGSRVDAAKLVSSMTLFGAVAGDLKATDTSGRFAELSQLADEIPGAGAAQGYPRCAHTLTRLAAARPRSASNGGQTLV